MDKFTMAALSTSITISAVNNLSIPFLGVPLNVVAVAAFGAIVSFAWGKPVEGPRKLWKLYSLFVGITFLAATFVAVVPYMMGWEWVKPELQPPFAGLVAAMMRFAIPPFIDLIPEVIRKIFRIEKKDPQ